MAMRRHDLATVNLSAGFMSFTLLPRATAVVNTSSAARSSASIQPELQPSHAQFTLKSGSFLHSRVNS